MEIEEKVNAFIIMIGHRMGIRQPNINQMKLLKVFICILFSLFRSKIHSEESSMADVMKWYNTVNAALLDHLTNQIKETDNSGVWR